MRAPTELLAHFAGQPRTHFVYRAFDADGVALYVGCTNDVARRLGEHRRYSRWFRYAVEFVVDSEPQVDVLARTAERSEIRRLRPAFNLGANHEHYRPVLYAETAAA